MKRLLTAAVGIPAVLLLTIYAPNWLFALVVAACAALMLNEFLNLSAASGRTRPGRWFLPVGAAVTAAFASTASVVVETLGVVSILLMTVVVFRTPIAKALDSVTTGLAGTLYCCVLMGFLVALPRRSILVLFAIIWLGDSLAYYGGRAFGRHPLAPSVSPKKTIEGAIAGLIGSILGGALMGAWLLEQPWLYMAGIGLLTGAVGQIGDLAESALKRSAGVKDSSSILPGHGGILDRFDSLLFAAPLYYWFFKP